MGKPNKQAKSIIVKLRRQAKIYAQLSVQGEKLDTLSGDKQAIAYADKASTLNEILYHVRNTLNIDID